MCGIVGTSGNMYRQIRGIHKLRWYCAPVLSQRCFGTTTTTTATKPNKKKIDVAVVGSGRMGTIRARLVQANPRFNLVAIVDPVHESGRSLAEKHNVPAHASLCQTIRECKEAQTPLEALIVCSPTCSHEEVIKMAASHKLAVFVEKPVAESAPKIAELFQYTSKADILLCCGFQRRFDPSYVAALDAIQMGQIGTPVMAHIFFADHPVPSREFLLTGGNIFMDLSAHDIDYIMCALQDEVVSVYAVGTSTDAEFAAMGIHDNATMVMKFSKGATVTLFMSRSAVYGYDQRCEVFGSQGLVSVENVHMNTAVLSNHTGIHQSRLQHSFPERFDTAFALEMDGFADAIHGIKEWPITGTHCVNVQRVADAAQLSAKTGSVVML